MKTAGAGNCSAILTSLSQNVTVLNHINFTNKIKWVDGISFLIPQNIAVVK